MASQAKIPHFSLLLCLLITLATISQASSSTQIKNFNKVSRENFNKQSAEQAPLQKDTTTTTTTTTENTPLDSTESQYGLYSQKGSDSQSNNNNDEWYGDRQFEVDNNQFPTGLKDNALRDWQYAQWNKHQLEKQQKLKAQSQDPEGQVYKRTSYQKTSNSLDQNDREEYADDNNNNNNNNNNKNAYDNEKSEVDNDKFPTDDIAHWSFSQFKQWDKYQHEKQKLKDQSQDSEGQVYKRTSYKKTPDSWNRNNNNQQDFVEDNNADSYETPANTDVSRWDNNNYKYGNREEEDDQKYDFPDNNRWDSQYKSYEQQQQQQQQQPWNYENVNKQQKKGRSKEERLAKAQGMSDTRRGKYYYDIENDKYGEDHPLTKLNSYNGNAYANQFGEEEEEP